MRKENTHMYTELCDKRITLERYHLVRKCRAHAPLCAPCRVGAINTHQASDTSSESSQSLSCVHCDEGNPRTLTSGSDQSWVFLPSLTGPVVWLLFVTSPSLTWARQMRFAVSDVCCVWPGTTGCSTCQLNAYCIEKRGTMRAASPARHAS